jgi:hypothetical protein
MNPAPGSPTPKSRSSGEPPHYRGLFDTTSTKTLTKRDARDEMKEVENIRKECASDKKNVKR